MQNLRNYGGTPYLIALIHGGLGAAGEMQPVAKELSKNYGVLEPLQTGSTVEGQVQELKAVLEQNGNQPIILVGFSWGAMLSLILTSRYPELVSKLILISSGPLEAKYSKDIMQVRLSRLSTEDKNKISELENIVNNPSISALEKNNAFQKIGELFGKSESYDLIENDANEIIIEVDSNIYESVWPQAAKMRQDGEFIKLAKDIKCPVVVIHGDYDPHPFEGIKEPLEEVLKDIKFILLEKCGHTPWKEKFAKDKFYEILKNELI